MDAVGVIEHADNLGDGLGLTDVGEELVAQAFALRRTLNDPGDVDERHRSRQQSLGSEDGGQLGEPRVRQVDHTDVRLDRGERIVRREHLIAGQCVEKG
ncbi:hypothetical protein D9M72_570410 [compost metagenome]